MTTIMGQGEEQENKDLGASLRDRAAGLRPQPASQSSQSGIPSAGAFTPGPWRLRHATSTVVVAAMKRVRGDGIAESYQGEIASAYPVFAGKDERRANARLIAASPCMYAELESAALALDEAAKLLFAKGLGGCASIMAAHAEKARTCAAKARGEQP